MNKLKKILKRCKCGVFLIINEHRDYYQSAEDRLHELYPMGCPPDIHTDVYKKMVETDTIIDLQFYPDTPIGSYSVYHHDLNAALTEALECLEQ